MSASLVIPPSANTKKPEGVNQPLPLFAGDRLSRAEFERRYQAHPKKGRTYRGNGVHAITGQIQATWRSSSLSWWLDQAYLAATPGVEGSDKATIRLDNQNEPQPDLLLRLDRKLGGRSFVGPDDYLEGAPELIIEIAATSASYDMHDKKLVYARNGVREYLVVLTYEARVVWFVLREGEYEELQPDADGLLRSEVSPGL